MKNRYLTIFLSTFKISAFTFGGGYVIIPLLKKKFCEELQYIEEEEMLNLVSIAQVSPGAVAVNASILIGYKLAKFWGMVVSIIGTILPPMMIISIISLFYELFRANVVVASVMRGMQAGIAAIIIDVAFSLGANVAKEKSLLSNVLMVVTFVGTYLLNLNVAFLILGCASIGLIRAFFKRSECSE